MDAYSKAPFPDKYNDHRLEISSFKFNDYAGISSDNLQQLETRMMKNLVE